MLCSEKKCLCPVAIRHSKRTEYSPRFLAGILLREAWPQCPLPLFTGLPDRKCGEAHGFACGDLLDCHESTLRRCARGGAFRFQTRGTVIPGASADAGGVSHKGSDKMDVRSHFLIQLLQERFEVLPRVKQ